MVDFYLSDMLSGSVLAGIVEQSIAKAIQRNMDANTMTPLSIEDVTVALTSYMDQNAHLVHPVEVSDFAEARGIRITGVARHWRHKCKSD